MQRYQRLTELDGYAMSRTISTAIRAFQRTAKPGRPVPCGYCKTFVTANPAFVTVTTSTRKTSGVDGPNLSAYPPPKHLKVPSGLTPEQVWPRQ